jgi:hypothetical protein
MEMFGCKRFARRGCASALRTRTRALGPRRSVSHTARLGFLFDDAGRRRRACGIRGGSGVLILTGFTSEIAHHTRPTLVALHADNISIRDWRCHRRHILCTDTVSPGSWDHRNGPGSR